MVAFYFFSPRMLRSIPYGLLVRGAGRAWDAAGGQRRPLLKQSELPDP